MVFHQHNASAYKAEVVMVAIHKLDLSSSYSRNQIHNNLILVLQLKGLLRESKFEDNSGIMAPAEVFFDGQGNNFFRQ